MQLEELDMMVPINPLASALAGSGYASEVQRKRPSEVRRAESRRAQGQEDDPVIDRTVDNVQATPDIDRDASSTAAEDQRGSKDRHLDLTA
jgi:hypothetical protein